MLKFLTGKFILILLSFFALSCSSKKEQEGLSLFFQLNHTYKSTYKNEDFFFIIFELSIINNSGRVVTIPDINFVNETNKTPNAQLCFLGKEMKEHLILGKYPRSSQVYNPPDDLIIDRNSSVTKRYSFFSDKDDEVQLLREGGALFIKYNSDNLMGNSFKRINFTRDNVKEIMLQDFNNKSKGLIRIY